VVGTLECGRVDRVVTADVSGGESHPIVSENANKTIKKRNAIFINDMDCLSDD